MQLKDVHICNHFQVCQLPSQPCDHSPSILDRWAWHGLPSIVSHELCDYSLHLSVVVSKCSEPILWPVVPGTLWCPPDVHLPLGHVWLMAISWWLLTGTIIITRHPPHHSHSGPENRNYFVSDPLSSKHDKLHVIHITTSHHWWQLTKIAKYSIMSDVCLCPPSYPLS